MECLFLFFFDIGNYPFQSQRNIMLEYGAILCSHCLITYFFCLCEMGGNFMRNTYRYSELTRTQLRLEKASAYSTQSIRLRVDPLELWTATNQQVDGPSNEYDEIEYARL